MDETIHQLTTKFLKTLNSSLGKSNSRANLGAGSEVLSDPTLQIIIHMISCTKSLRDAFEATTAASGGGLGGFSSVSASGGLSSTKKPKSSIHYQLYQPMLNGILALLGKMLMDSFTYESKVTETAAFTAAYGILGRHVLSLFPEMATKKHKTSGKMLIHHAVFKARPEVAEETVGLILKVSPASSRAEDATGALPLHWATRNPEVSFEMIDMLIKAYPEAPSKTDNKGFLPLHWAVNQDSPNVEVVRKLIKIFPAGAGMPSLSGNLPLHYCVSRARPSIPVIKALITAYPEAIRSGCEEGYLPLHRYLYRPIVDLDALRLLINYFPDSLLAKSNRNQTPLHVALDHHTPDAMAVELLLEMCPTAVSVCDSDQYLPLHLCLDCAEPNYALALQLLTRNPPSARQPTKDGMYPLHLLVGSNSDPTYEHMPGIEPGGPNEAVEFVTALLNANPQALVTSVLDIIPAMDGEALADPESWSGEWVEAYWSPLTRARDRGLTGLVSLFKQFQAKHGIVDPTDPQAASSSSTRESAGPNNQSTGSNLAAAHGASAAKPIQHVADVRFNENNHSLENININAARPLKSEPLRTVPATVLSAAASTPTIVPASAPAVIRNNYSGANPLRVRRVDSNSEDDQNIYPHTASEDEEGDRIVIDRTARMSKPSSVASTVKVPPHILRAQQIARTASSNGSQSGESRDPSRERGSDQHRQQQAILQQQYQRQLQRGSSKDGSYGNNLIAVESYDEQLSMHGNSRDTTPLRQGIGGGTRSQSGNGGRAPPGPIPATLLQAAENTAAVRSRPTVGGIPGISAAQQQLINDAARASRRTSNAVPAMTKKSAPSPKSPKGSFNFSDGGMNNEKIGLASTTGRTLPSNNNNNNNSKNSNNNHEQEEEPYARAGTAPVVNTAEQSRIVGIGSNTAWSQSPSQQQQQQQQPVALNAKQQRLLLAQQQYMRRAAAQGGGSGVDANSSNVISVKPSPTTFTSTGIHNKAAPTNHTSEIIKNMGGKVRIHPLGGSSGSTQAMRQGNSVGLDEMV